MISPTLYPGGGKALRRVSGATGNTLVNPETTTIPAGGYTEIIGGADCIDLIFEAVFAAAATGTMNVMKASNQAVAASDVFDAVAISGVDSWNWNSGEMLLGHYFVHNDSDQAATIKVQKRLQ